MISSHERLNVHRITLDLLKPKAGHTSIIFFWSLNEKNWIDFSIDTTQGRWMNLSLWLLYFDSWLLIDCRNCVGRQFSLQLLQIFNSRMSGRRQARGHEGTKFWLVHQKLGKIPCIDSLTHFFKYPSCCKNQNGISGCNIGLAIHHFFNSVYTV